MSRACHVSPREVWGEQGMPRVTTGGIEGMRTSASKKSSSVSCRIRISSAWVHADDDRIRDQLKACMAWRYVIMPNSNSPACCTNVSHSPTLIFFESMRATSSFLPLAEAAAYTS